MGAKKKGGSCFRVPQIFDQLEYKSLLTKVDTCEPTERGARRVETDSRTLIWLLAVLLTESRLAAAFPRMGKSPDCRNSPVFMANTDGANGEEKEWPERLETLVV